MPLAKRNRGPRRVLLATAAAVALGAGGAGVAYASSNDAGPVETGYVVVETSDGTPQDAADPNTTAGTDRECEKQGAGTPDVEGQL